MLPICSLLLLWTCYQKAPALGSTYVPMALINILQNLKVDTKYLWLIIIESWTFSQNFPRKSRIFCLIYVNWRKEILYVAILGLQQYLVLKLLNYLSTVNSHIQDKIKLDVGDGTPIPLWSSLHTDDSGRINWQRTAPNPWFNLLLNCIPNRNMVCYGGSHPLRATKEINPLK